MTNFNDILKDMMKKGASIEKIAADFTNALNEVSKKKMDVMDNLVNACDGYCQALDDYIDGETDDTWDALAALVFAEIATLKPEYWENASEEEIEKAVAFVRSTIDNTALFLPSLREMTDKILEVVGHDYIR